MIAQYDEKHEERLNKGSGINALKFLMEQHGLDQADLKKEIGIQGVVSEILNGKRQLILRISLGRLCLIELNVVLGDPIFNGSS